MTVSD